MATTAHSLSQRWLAYFYLLVNTIVWGAALVVVKPAFADTTPFRFLFWRFLLASICSLPIIWHYFSHMDSKQKTQILKKVAVLELLGTTVALSALYLGLAQTTAVEASLLTTAVPVFVTIGGIFWLKERQELHEWLGLSLAVIGTIALTLIPLWTNLSTAFQGSVVGNVLVLTHNMSMAAYLLLIKTQYARLPKLLVSCLSFFVGAVTFGGLAWWESGWATGSTLVQIVRTDLTTPSVLLAVVFMAIFGSIIGLTAYIKGQALIEASEASWFWYLQPLVYVPLAYMWLHETTSWLQLAALALTIFGVFIAERRQHRLPAAPTKRRSSTSRSRS